MTRLFVINVCRLTFLSEVSDATLKNKNTRVTNRIYMYNNKHSYSCLWHIKLELTLEDIVSFHLFNRTLSRVNISVKYKEIV